VLIPACLCVWPMCWKRKRKTLRLTTEKKRNSRGHAIVLLGVRSCNRAVQAQMAWPGGHQQPTLHDVVDCFLDYICDNNKVDYLPLNDSSPNLDEQTLLLFPTNSDVVANLLIVSVRYKKICMWYLLLFTPPQDTCMWYLLLSTPLKDKCLDIDYT
jgi:hypothetical protein